MKSKILAFYLGSVFLFGCGGDRPANSSVNANTNAVNANTANANTDGKSADVAREKLLISGVGATLMENCDGREVEFDDEAVGNNYIFRGECKKITVSGVANKIEVERVGEIVIAGVSNKVVYLSGLNDKKPKISKTGKDTLVESKEISEKNRKLQEQKEAAEAAKIKKSVN